MLLAAAAHADLYRWVDRESGSVKFSNVPPPASQPGVELLPGRGATAARKPEPSGASALEARWRELLGEISQSRLDAAPDPVLERRLREFAAAASELDRLDPAGADARRAQAQKALQRLTGSTP